MEIIKKFSGHSGSDVFLINDPVNGLTVKKIGNVARNIERISALSELNLPVCKILNFQDTDWVEFEYIHGLDIASYLTRNPPKKLIDFLITTLKKLSNNKLKKNYEEILLEYLKWVDTCNDLPFTLNQLVNRVNLELWSSHYHGDLTLENILFSDDRFILIDAVTTVYDSYLFDIAKLRQDLDCKWFIRKKEVYLESKLTLIKNSILEEFPEANNNIFLIMMLLRVYLHTKPGDSEREFILREVNKLW